MELELKIHVPDNLVIDDEQKAGQGMAEAVRDPSANGAP